MVLSLGFVAFQIKQSNDHARAAISYDINDSFAGYHDLIAGDADLAAIVLQLRRPDPEFTDAESVRALSIVMRLFNTWMAIHRAHLNGLITDGEYETWKTEVAATAAGWPGAESQWRRMIESRPHLRDVPLLAPIIERM